ncbi:uncharacterized protein [Paralichthys olivaceus]|uniref:uncharacterized protein n=1 Tax=Paralichthys olivaceus TaxID=8255 RepID=UPI0037508F68
MRAAATMSGTAAASGFVFLLLSVPVVQCENGWGVRYTSTEICVPRGSTVDINCTYTYPSRLYDRDVTVQKTFWFIKDSNGIYVDLMTDPEYSGRVEYLCENNKCTLRISDLRETDSAVYKFRFTTNQDSFTGSAGVTLSVPDLHVQVNAPVKGKSINYAKLKCQSSCRLPDHLTYVWYKNQQKKIEGASYSAWFDSADTVSCAVKGLEDLHSPSLLVRSQNGWDVRYTSTEICVPRGSTVDINCSYTYPSRVNDREVTVQKTFWFIKDSNGIYVDLMTDPEYSGRVEYLCENNKCTLRISDLRETDSAVYKFRFTTNQPTGRFTGSAGVTLSVPDLHVQVSTSVEGYSYNYAKLKCQSSCRLPDHLTYVWYKNQQKKIEGASYSDWFYSADTVSCAVKGLEDFHSPSLLVQSQRGWNVRYTSTEICVPRGSTVDINCSYTYPSRLYDREVTVQKTFWFKENQFNVDLKTQSQYSGRVEYLCGNNKCTLRISHLRETDSAVYKFTFTTNQESFTGSAGVTLSVTDPQLQVHVRRSTANPYPTWTELTCHSSCQLPDHLSYVWFKNNKLVGWKKYFLLQHFNAGDNYHCAIEGHGRFPSPTLSEFTPLHKATIMWK